MKGAVAVKTIAIFVLIVVGIAVGARVLQGTIEDEQYKAYRTSTQAVGLDISGLVALSAVATENIYINYEIANEIEHSVVVDEGVATITRTEEPIPEKHSVVYSVPFDFDNPQQTSHVFRISNEVKKMEEEGKEKYASTHRVDGAT